MKTRYKNERLTLLPETPDEISFCKDLTSRIIDSNLLMAWYGDVEFDGKETSGYIITYQPSNNPPNELDNLSKKYPE